MEVDQPVIPVVFKTEEDFEANFETQLFLNWVYFHEVTELHLVLKGIKAANTRWFRDGLAEYMAYKVCKKLSPETAKNMLQKRRESYQEVKGNANLLNWTGTGISENPEQDEFKGGTPQYGAGLLFFIDLVNDHGEDIIIQLFQALKNERDLSSKNILLALDKLTKEDTYQRVKRY
ncbi:hypothetical protein [Aquimarina sp. 2201CG5-10]|uniref:hypothetical protein n=1 Tax=Aquimarina callyspongiae TaxID=3098150 RepID=UPI002AB36C99|nr:hypothetical protein [Aquimarina sp. 2201CG5-10]MDY8137054.1 hypothetical protein [Aquimarina sp. 2201CG5-10]